MTRRLASFWLLHPIRAYRFHRAAKAPFTSDSQPSLSSLELLDNLERETQKLGVELLDDVFPLSVRVCGYVEGSTRQIWAMATMNADYTWKWDIE